MGEPVWEGYLEGFDAREAKGPGFYFWIPLVDLSPEQTGTIREQAEEVLGYYARSQRTIIVQTFRAIVRVTTIRLETPAPGPVRVNAYLVRVAPDPSDPLDQVGDDRGHIIARALALAEDPDPMVGKVWSRIAMGFDMLRYRIETLS